MSIDNATEQNPLTRRAFLKIMVAEAAMLATGAHLLAQPLTSAVKTEETKPPGPDERLERPDEILPPLNPNTNDMCKLIETSNQVDRRNAGEQVPAETIFPQRDRELTQLKISLADFINFVPEFAKTDKQIKVTPVVLPVGYDRPLDLQPILDLVNRLYRPYGVDFVLLNKSVPLGINAVERFAFLTDVSEIAQVMKKINDISNELFLLPPLVLFNEKRYMGSGGFRAAVAAGGNEKSAYLSAHELGHSVFWLGDEYPRFYTASNIWGHTTMFTTTKSSGITWLKELIPDLPAETPIGKTCDGFPVYGFYNDTPNLMKNLQPTNQEMAEMLKKGTPFFNPIQESIIKNAVAYYASQKLKNQPS